MTQRKTFIIIFVLALLACSLLGGCGGGGIVDGGSGGGDVKFTVAWPAGSPASSQVSPALMPEAVRSVTLVLTVGGRQVVPPQTVTREVAGPQTVEVLFRDVPAGKVAATATAYPNPDGTGTPLARGSVVVEVSPGQTVTTALSMDSTIVTLVVDPPAAYIPLGSNTPLTVTGRDAAARVVLITLGKLQWNYNASVVSVDSGGVCSAVGAGFTDVTVTDTESGRSGKAAIYVGTSPPEGTVFGQVRNTSGQPISGATVTATGDQYGQFATAQTGEPPLLTTTTGPDGHYMLPFVPLGAQAISAAAPGYRTINAMIIVASNAVRYDAVLPTTLQPSPQEPPTVTMNAPVLNETAGLATISGTITEMDSDTAVLIHNGQESLVSVNSGQFTHVVVLRVGTNLVQIRATNAVGTGFSDLQVIEFTGGTGDFYFRVTLTWDTGAPVNSTDVDLHVWSPTAEHCYYGNDTIAAGSLDVDNTSGFGPENFTCTTMEAGVFKVAVNYYYGDYPPTRGIIRVTTGNLATLPASVGKPVTILDWLFGPHELTVPNGDTGYPVTVNTPSWWRVCDVLLVSDGTVSVSEPDTGIVLPAPAGVGTAGKKRPK